MIHLLPVIPEDKVVCNCVEDWHTAVRPTDHIDYDPPNRRVGDDYSGFGYVAILRNDTVLLEIGRSSGLYDDEDSVHSDFDDVLHSLDCTIYGLLHRDAVPGWDMFCLTTDSTNSHSHWKGLRFHVFDDNEGKSDAIVWTFCLVYRCAERDHSRPSVLNSDAFLLQHYQEWIVRNLIQFTEFFRKNDIVWKTGSALSCQFLFAPVVEQRMHLNPPTHTKRRIRTSYLVANDSHNDDDVSWTVVAEQIIQRNLSIIHSKAAEEAFPVKEYSTTMAASTSFQTPIHPFVSDESDCEDNDSNSSLGKISLENDEHESTSSEYDDESKESDSCTSPVRKGAFPRFFNNEDDNIACLERLAAYNSIWKSVEKSRKSNDVPLIALLDHSFLPVTSVPLPPAPCISNTDDAYESWDSDEENIRVICLVENQVDAQHSDLWKRSPKCISKAVALGLSPRPQKPVTSPTLPVKALTVSDVSSKEVKKLSSPLDIVASAIAETFVKFWKHVSSLPEDNRNLSTDEARTDHHDGCWCRIFFKPKSSALL